MTRATTNIDERFWLAKITVTTIGCDPSQALLSRARVHLCTIGGIVTGTKQVAIPKSKSATVTALTGEFYATNRQTGVEYRASIAYLPHRYHDPLIERLKTEPRIEFAYNIYSEPVGRDRYSYIAERLI
jgi:hypothetical protein